MSKSGMALFFSMTAIALSAFALHKAVSIDQTSVQSENQPTLGETRPPAPIPTSPDPKLDRPELRSESSVRKQPSNVSKSDIRRVTYRGSEKVVNIGEDLDVDAFYYAPTSGQGVVNIGEALDTELN